MTEIDITLNGDTRRIPDGLTVEGLLKTIGLDPRKVAIERNLEIVPRSRYGQIPVVAGDRLEVVHFIGGGR